MAFALLIIGITLIVSAVQNTHEDLLTLVVGDFSGPNNFLYWALAIFVVGSIGYAKSLKPISTGLLIIVVLALFLSKDRGGFFKMFTEAIGTTTKTSGPTTAPSALGANVDCPPGMVYQGIMLGCR